MAEGKVDGAIAIFNVGASLWEADQAAGSSREVNRQNTKALQLDRRKSELTNMRSSESRVHKGQAAIADISSVANMMGVAGSSTAQQVKGSLSTQIGLESSYMNSQQLLDEGILTANQAALDEQAEQLQKEQMMSYIGQFANAAMAAKAMGLTGAHVSAFASAAGGGASYIYALAAANPVIAAALIVVAILGPEETKRIGRDLDSTIGTKALKDRTDSTIKEGQRAQKSIYEEEKRILGDVEDGLKDVGNAIADVFGW